MEKAVRAAIQRHMRGWSPYPNVRVVPTERGHTVYWAPKEDILSKSELVRIDTEGTPSKSNFAMLRVAGERQWTRDDMHMMEHDEYLRAMKPRMIQPPTASILALSEQECQQAMEHVKACFKHVADAAQWLDLIKKQSFSTKNALHTTLDVLAMGGQVESWSESKENVGAMVRVLLGHAVESEQPVWACAFSHLKGPWNDMGIAIWQDDAQWHVSVVSQKEPMVYSDYRFVKGAQKQLQFVDKLPENGPRDMWQSRGSVERYYQSYHRSSHLGAIHYASFEQLLSGAVSQVAADSIWVQPLQKGPALDWKQGEFAIEYHSFARTFEEKAFQCLSVAASTPAGQSLLACMSVSKTLEEPTKNMTEWQTRLAVWQQAMHGQNTLAFTIDSCLFESPSA